jgi:hypothetical protein
VESLWAPAAVGAHTPPPPPPPAPTRRRGLWAALAVVALVCFAGAGVSYWWTQRGPDHPERWDPRVADLAAFVESERGVDFEHPVTVHFMTPEEYEEATSSGEGEPADEVVDAAAEQVGMFRALGLMTGEVDLLASGEALFGAGTAAFYDPVGEQVVVNAAAGDELSVATAVTVVHELTHVLQDQTVELDEVMGDEERTTDAADAHLAIVEGDAMVVEDAYLASLSPDEVAEYDEEWAALAEESEAAVDAAEVPEAMDLLFGVPYAVGPSYVIVADATGDRDVVDAAIAGAVPPSLAVLELETDSWPDGPAPDAPEVDGDVLETDTMGAMSWLVVLGGASTPDATLAAVSGWEGDRTVTWTDGSDRVCVDAEIVVDPEVTGESSFLAAATRWAASLPEQSGAVVSAPSEDRVQLHTCDPGPGVEIAAARSGGAASAVEYVAIRNSIVAELLGAPEMGFGRDAALCYGEGLLAEFGVEQLSATSGDAALLESAEFARAAARVGATCAAEPGG